MSRPSPSAETQAAAFATRAPRPPSARHVVIGLGAVLVLSVLWGSRVQGERVYPPLFRWPLPHTCYTRAWFGFECPGCGMTRGMIHWMHGQASDGQRLNPASVIMLTMVALQPPFRAWAVARRRLGLDDPPIEKITGGFVVAAFTVMLAQWLLRTFT